MKEYPDFSAYGYQIEQILGRNHTGGRVTYLAKREDSRQPVVIKQYQFAKTGLSWTGYQSYQSEIKILRSLFSQNIPRYLDSFDTSTGFCLVQEYKNAPSLEHSRLYTPQEVKTIGLALLEVLIYLQKQVPTVIHGDLKPENILIDPEDPGRIYLVDFGFARVGSGDVTYSSVIKGTVGFMPPEEMFNRILTKASDLYSLGVTLVCLLTHTKSPSIADLIDEKSYQLQYKSRLPKNIHPQFIQWLDRLVAPSADDRYPNAYTAWRALESIPATGGLSCLQNLPPLSKTNTLISAGLLGMLSMSGLFGFQYWQGRPLDRLLNSKSCADCSLPNANLNGADLKGADLRGANLAGADLRGANLESANLESANLTGAKLEEVNLSSTNLEKSILRDSRLLRANLMGANLESANLENAVVDDANVVEANLKYTNLNNAKFRFARLTNSNLEGANLGGTDLGGAVLRGTTLPDGKKSP
jgi:uncharacterized protein YjbI with pentapeptide repeats